ncbi:MAG: hypothetical protein OHK0053_14950 [Microscillaceae bacterium]
MLALLHLRRKNVQVFLLCLFSAALLWVFNALNQERIETVRYPLELLYDSDRFIALEPPPDNVYLKLRGTGWQILWKMLRIQTAPIRILVRGYSQSRPYLTLTHYRREIENQVIGLKVEYVLNETLSLKLDRKVKRRFFIKVNPFKIRLAPKHRLVSEINIFPRQITLVGPESYLRSLRNPYELSLPDMVHRQDYEAQVTLHLPFENSNLIHQEQSSIDVSFKVAEFVERTARLVIKKENFPSQGHFTIPREERQTEIKYAVPKSALGRIRLKEFVLTADFNTFNPLDSTVALFIRKKPQSVRSDDITFKKRIKLVYE